MQVTKPEICLQLVQHWAQLNSDNNDITLRDWLVTFTILMVIAMRSANIDQNKFDVYQQVLGDLLRTIYHDTENDLKPATVQ